ncbi:hypothetical protein QKW60_12700 [Defluviimonas aestuarii]|uniref:hypothetical protein n=1 Tax=Albidovulum aestuarii TaxID=1130726 RepID=UPI00249B4576|nr:hypothetical protein [Defluviimonas aestuarii]MDI3337270.1 hypothetical protein [Defluviimonas aestuarii]
MRNLAALIFTPALAAGGAAAQNRDGLFATDAGLIAFIEEHAKKRDIGPLLRELGGADDTRMRR